MRSRKIKNASAEKPPKKVGYDANTIQKDALIYFSELVAFYILLLQHIGTKVDCQTIRDSLISIVSLMEQRFSDLTGVLILKLQKFCTTNNSTELSEAKQKYVQRILYDIQTACTSGEFAIYQLYRTITLFSDFPPSADDDSVMVPGVEEVYPGTGVYLRKIGLHKYLPNIEKTQKSPNTSVRLLNTINFHSGRIKTTKLRGAMDAKSNLRTYLSSLKDSLKSLKETRMAALWQADYSTFVATIHHTDSLASIETIIEEEEEAEEQTTDGKQNKITRFFRRYRWQIFAIMSVIIIAVVLVVSLRFTLK